MTLVWIILTLVGLLALAAVVLHFLPRSSDVRIAKLEDDANWLWDRVFPSHAGVTATAGPAVLVPRPAVDPLAPVGTQTGTGTWTTPGKAGQIGDVPSVMAINAAAQAKIAAWLAPAIDWTKVTADELMALMRQMTASVGTTTMDYVTGAVATIPAGGVVNPNFAAQGAFLRGEPTTESQRAYVGYNNADGIWAHFKIGPDGTLVAQ